MNTKNRTLRTGLAALALAATLTTVAGPAAADIPLVPPSSSSPSDIAGTSTGSGNPASGSAQREDGTGGGAGSGSASGSATGSQQLVNPFSSAPMGNSTVAETILKALDYVPCSSLSSPHTNSVLASTVALLMSLTTGTWYMGAGCAS
ncbi:hypothetical protein ACQP1O_10165 [Nocardia sp. CA-151230]|uniref:hypothetical protein n=1 Tax=Nocardia sp. CA-151230 TaxID=3239982 RepID=UPI003D8D29BA